MVHLYHGTLLSHKNSEVMPSAATWEDLEIITPSEPDKDTCHFYMEPETNLFTKQTHRHRKQTMVTKGER